ncbi:MAG: hypothetical protein ACRESO_09970, partial [Gammaproteobacteria bacterium]
KLRFSPLASRPERGLPVRAPAGYALLGAVLGGAQRGLRKEEERRPSNAFLFTLPVERAEHWTE